MLNALTCNRYSCLSTAFSMIYFYYPNTTGKHRHISVKQDKVSTEGKMGKIIVMCMWQDNHKRILFFQLPLSICLDEAFFPLCGDFTLCGKLIWSRY